MEVVWLEVEFDAQFGCFFLRLLNSIPYLSFPLHAHWESQIYLEAIRNLISAFHDFVNSFEFLEGHLG